MYRKKTLRRMGPITRRYARTLNALDGITKRLANLTQDIARLELDSQALFNKQKATATRAQTPTPDIPTVRELRPEYASLKIYQVQNRITKEEHTIAADSAQEACEKLGWNIGNCWIRILLDPSDDKHLTDEQWRYLMTHEDRWTL